MKLRFLASFALAFSLLAPAICAANGASFDAGSLRVEKRGQGERAVILIPGLASGSWVWRDTATWLAKSHAVYLVTLPGFDGHPAEPEVSFASLRRDLLTLIEMEKLDKPVIIGHSLGGALSLDFASDHSSRISGVISVDGLPVFPSTENSPDRKALGENLRTQVAAQSREQFEAGQLGYMRSIGTLNEALAGELARLAARSDIRATAEFAAMLMAADLRPRLKSIQVPVLVISPFHAPDYSRLGVDEGMKAGYYRGLLAGTPDLEVVSISPARHFVMFDQPEKFAKALDQALSRMFEHGAG